LPARVNQPADANVDCPAPLPIHRENLIHVVPKQKNVT